MVELHLRCPQHLVEALSDALLGWGALSVSVLDADAQTHAEHALYAEPGSEPVTLGWASSQVQALFGEQAQATRAAQRLRASKPLRGCDLLGSHTVPEQDWVRLTQAQFEPVAITPQFWVVASWHSVPAQAKQAIVLDPGLAFGTGTHATTRMCLRWIANNPPRGQRVLDYGCGSGILAIAAAKFGASSVLAVDIDPVAVATTDDNARANRVSLESGLPERASEQYNLVLANILATPLKVLAPLLSARLLSAGQLLLAGILERQTEELMAAYRPYLKLELADCEDGWVLLKGSA